MRYALTAAALTMAIVTGCTRHDSEKARQEVRRAGQQLRHDAREATRQLHRDVDKMKRDLKERQRERERDTDGRR